MNEATKETTQIREERDDRFFTPRQRQLNIDMILNAIDKRTDFTFQQMLYAYADFSQAVFMNGIVADASSEDEATQAMARVARGANAILDALEKNSSTQNGAEDFAALMTVALDLLDYLYRQQEDAKQNTQ